MNDIKESKFRLIVAWVSWWLMLSSMAGIFAFVIGLSVFYYIGGSSLLSAIWLGKEEGSYLWVIIASASGVPFGAKLGVWLWVKFVRKFKLISNEQISKMGG